MATVAHAPGPVVLVRADDTAEREHVPDGSGKPSARTPYRDLAVAVDVVVRAMPCWNSLSAPRSCEERHCASCTSGTCPSDVRPALGMRIGPVTHGVIHHAAAPVAVVPHG